MADICYMINWMRWNLSRSDGIGSSGEKDLDDWNIERMIDGEGRVKVDQWYGE